MKNKGITLISLVITIIILIILASVAIYLSLGNNGIFIRAKQAKEETNKQEATDIINLKITTAQMNKYAEKQEMPTLQELADTLYEDNEIQYVALESKIGDKEKVIVGEKTSIYTKLNKYPYEFEINSSLQLASINGIKIANQNNDEELKKLQNELDNYKKAIAESLTKNGVETAKEDSIETMTQNIDKIFLAGVHSKFIKVAENVSSRYVQNINVSDNPNYKKFSVDNFVIVNKQMNYVNVAETDQVLEMNKIYDQETGILTLGKQKSYSNVTNSKWTFYNIYDVYVFNEQ